MIRNSSMTFFTAFKTPKNAKTPSLGNAYIAGISHQAEDIAVQGSSEFVNGWFAPASGMVTERASIRNGRIQSGNLQIRVRWRWSVALHSNQPRWWNPKSN